jgi:hypothetical protein
MILPHGLFTENFLILINATFCTLSDGWLLRLSISDLISLFAGHLPAYIES